MYLSIYYCRGCGIDFAPLPSLFCNSCFFERDPGEFFPRPPFLKALRKSRWRDNSWRPFKESWSSIEIWGCSRSKIFPTLSLTLLLLLFTYTGDPSPTEYRIILGDPCSIFLFGDVTERLVGDDPANWFLFGEVRKGEVFGLRLFFNSFKFDLAARTKWGLSFKFCCINWVY